MDMFVFTGILWKEDDEYSALCPELDVASQGKTLAEARKNLLEAASLHLEGSFEDGLPYLHPALLLKIRAIRFRPKRWKSSNSKWT